MPRFHQNFGATRWLLYANSWKSTFLKFICASRRITLECNTTHHGIAEIKKIDHDVLWHPDIILSSQICHIKPIYQFTIAHVYTILKTQNPFSMQVENSWINLLIKSSVRWHSDYCMCISVAQKYKISSKLGSPPFLGCEIPISSSTWNFTKFR